MSGLNEVTSISAGSLYSLAAGPQLPTVTNVNPNSGAAAGETTVTITGTNFTGVTAVKFGANNAKSFTFNSATSITAVSPAGAGVVNVTVSTPAGSSAPNPADEFSYLPTVTGLNPSTGPQAGKTSVEITGTNFSGATAVKFGTATAPSFTVNSATSITAVSTAGAGIVDVTVTTPGGTSATSSADRFSYVGAPPEFGRCVRVTTGTGAYGDASCTTLGGENKYEWLPGPGESPTFTTKIKTDTTFTWESVSASKITCKTEKSSGEYSGPKTVGNVIFTFGGCAFGGSKCTAAGAKEGEVKTNALVGELGVVKASTEGVIDNEIGLDLKAPGTGALAEFSCGSITVKWRGSVIEAVKSNKMILSAVSKYTATKGKQKPEGFEGQPKDIIESSLGSGAFEQSAWTLDTTQTDKEKIEVNSVV